MYTRELERQVRSFLGQRMEVAYIQHYLMETYAIDQRMADDIIRKAMPPVGRGKSAATPASGRAAVVSRPKFY